MQILLVEPDKDVAASIASAFEAVEGWKVAHATTAQAAIEAADKAKPDVVVLELGLAGHNGVEFLYEFKSYEEWLDIPIVVLTMQRLANHQQLHAIGANLYLYKPHTSLAELVRRVRELTTT